MHWLQSIVKFAGIDFEYLRELVVGQNLFNFTFESRYTRKLECCTTLTHRGLCFGSPLRACKEDKESTTEYNYQAYPVDVESWMDSAVNVLGHRVANG